MKRAFALVGAFALVAASLSVALRACAPRVEAAPSGAAASSPAAGAATAAGAANAAGAPAIGRAPKRAARSDAESAARARSIASARNTIAEVLAEMETGRSKAKKGAARSIARVAFLAESLESGETIAALHESTLLEAASNVKLFTTAAALLRLGRDFRFETRFASDAPVAEATLQGDLWAIGGGDPTLSTDFGPGGAVEELGRVADFFRARGVTRVAGALVLDDRLFVDAPYSPLWPAKDRGKPHALDVSPLFVEHDRVTVEARAEEGGLASIQTTPKYSGYSIDNLVRVVPKKDAGAGIVAHVSNDVMRVSGVVAEGGTASTSFSTLQPSRLFGAVARGVFEERGIVFERTARPPEAHERAPEKTWLVLPSRVPLEEVVRRTNRESDNLLADTMLKVLGAKTSGEGSLAAGVAAVRAELLELGVPTAGYSAVDGSGLSHESKLSPRAIVDLLRAMARTRDAEIFRTSLAVGGEPPGTLRGRFRDSVFAGRLRAKTGSLQGVTALSGYASALAGDTELFSMLTTYEERAGTSFKGDEERVVRALVEISSP